MTRQRTKWGKLRRNREGSWVVAVKTTLKNSSKDTFSKLKNQIVRKKTNQIHPQLEVVQTKKQPRIALMTRRKAQMNHHQILHWKKSRTKLRKRKRKWLRSRWVVILTGPTQIMMTAKSWPQNRLCWVDWSAWETRRQEGIRLRKGSTSFLTLNLSWKCLLSKRRSLLCSLFLMCTLPSKTI